jgi:site-specific DNA recombinase
MGHTFSSQGMKRYRYYVCMKAQRRGWDNCPTKSIPAGEIEKYVIEQIRAIGKDRTVLDATVRKVREQRQKSLADLQKQERALQKELVRHNAEVKKLSASAQTVGNAAAISQVEQHIREAQQRGIELRDRIVALSRDLVDEREVATALTAFDPVWSTLSPREQARVIALLVERVEYDGKRGTVAITFRPNGMKILSQEIKEVAA